MHRRSPCCAERGEALVSFVLVELFLLFLTVGGIELLLLLQKGAQYEELARTVARQSMVQELECGTAGNNLLGETLQRAGQTSFAQVSFSCTRNELWDHGNRMCLVETEAEYSCKLCSMIRMGPVIHLTRKLLIPSEGDYGCT